MHSTRMFSLGGSTVPERSIPVGFKIVRLAARVTSKPLNGSEELTTTETLNCCASPGWGPGMTMGEIGQELAPSLAIQTIPPEGAGSVTAKVTATE